MKRISILILVIFTLACRNENAEKTRVYNQKDFNEKIEIIDTFCINQTKKAKLDIKNKNFYFF